MPIPYKHMRKARKKKVSKSDVQTAFGGSSGGKESRGSQAAKSKMVSTGQASKTTSKRTAKANVKRNAVPMVKAEDGSKVKATWATKQRKRLKKRSGTRKPGKSGW